MPLNQNVLNDLYGDQEPIVNPLGSIQDITPDNAAKGLQINKAKGIDALIAARNLPQLQGELDQDHWDKFVQDNPTTSKLMSKDPARAAVLKDQMAQAGDLEKAIRTGHGANGTWEDAKTGSWTPDRTLTETLVTDPLKAVAVGVNTLAASVVEASRYSPGQMIVDSIMGAVAPEQLAKKRKYTDDVQTGFNANADYWTAQKSESMAQRNKDFSAAPIGESLRMLATDPALVADQLLQSAAYLAPGAAAARVGTAATLVFNGLSEGLDAANSARQEAIKKGRTTQEQDQAATIALLITAPTALLANKMLGTAEIEQKFLTQGKLDGLLKPMIKEFFAGSIEEGANQFGVNAGATVYDPTRKLGEGVAKAAVIGGVLEATHATGMHAISKAADVMLNREIDAENALAQNERMGKIQDAIRAAAMIGQRSPETFQQLIQNIAEDAGDAPTEVWINGQALVDAAQAAGVSIEQLAPSAIGQLDTALAANGDVAIPVGEWGANIATQPIGDTLLQHVKTDLGGMTVAEVEQFKQEQAAQFQTEAEKLMREKEKDTAFVEGAREVQATIYDQLQQTGRNSAEVNRTYATFMRDFYVTMAGHFNTTPNAVYAKIPYKITTDGQAVFSQEVAEKTIPLDSLKLNEDGAATARSFYSWNPDAKVVNTKPVAVVQLADQSYYLLDGYHRAIGVKREKGTDIAAKIFPPTADMIQRLRTEGVAENLLPVESAQAPNVYHQSLSTRVPKFGKVVKIEALQSVLGIDYETLKSDPLTLAKNVDALRDLPNFPAEATGDAAHDVELFINHVADNLTWLHNLMPAEWRDRARLWYDGGRLMAETWANRYGISEMQAAASIAVLSPQNDWFQNVSSAERIADIMFGMRDFKWTPDMGVTAASILKTGQDELAKMKKEPKSRTKAGKEKQLKDLAAKEKKIADDLAAVEAVTDKTLGEILHLEPIVIARWVRAFDETHNSRDYNILTPEGGSFKTATTNAGAPSKNAWKTYVAMAKAISILLDGRAENTFYQIGGEHKVRNFYNNIFAPNSPMGFTTIDTHAVAAANMQPFSGNDDPVVKAFGSAGSASSAKTGLRGTYAIYLEAYRRSAEKLGILPREMQSITWEAVRGLFEGLQKTKLKPITAAIWDRVKSGEITQEQALEEILVVAGGIKQPSWVEAPFNNTPGRTYSGMSQEAVDARPSPGPHPTKTAAISFEVAPNPDDFVRHADWLALDKEDQDEITQIVTAAAIPRILKEFSTNGEIKTRLGGYLGENNPSLVLELEREELMVPIAKAIGYVLDQKGMVAVNATEVTGTKASETISIKLPEGYGRKEIDALYHSLWTLERDGNKLVTGYSAVDGSMFIMNYSSVPTDELSAIIQEHIGADFDIQIDQAFVADIDKDTNNYGYNERTEGGSASGLEPSQQRTIDSIRDEAAGSRDRLVADALADTRGRTRDRRAAGVGEAQSLAASSKGSEQDLVGLPNEPILFADGSTLVPSAFAKAREIAVKYMKSIGLEYNPPQTYKVVDKARAAKIAAAYAEMPHAPNDPQVKAAFEQLGKETIAQYEAILASGIRFEFVDFAATGDPYPNPRQAIMDVIDNNHMYIFSTRDGFGSNEEFDPANNPLLAETEFMISGKKALVNDLFRAVHDYFGHLKDGNGFRAKGEENAWRAHAAMFSPLARRALTTETRGQNSWLNFGPHGESNRTAVTSDTVFADQKTGLLPEWASEEGLADDPAQLAQHFNQESRGGFDPASLTTILNKEADLSTFLHETSHFFLTAYSTLAADVNAPDSIKADMQEILNWFGVESLATWNSMTVDQQRPYHEQFAYNYEIYLFEGKAPSIKLQSSFDKFTSWLTRVYKSIRDDLNTIYKQQFGKDLPGLTPEITGVFDRMLASEDRIKQAEAVRNMMPLFQNEIEAQMTKDEWAAYQLLGTEGTQEALAKHQKASLREMKWLGNARSRVLKEMQKTAAETRKRVKAEVEAELMAEPIYRAMRFLKRGEIVNEKGVEIKLDGKATAGAKLSIDALKEMYPETGLVNVDWFKLGKGKYGMLSDDGLHPDMAASIFGIDSGDALVRDLLATEPLADKVEARTDQRMLEEHSALHDPKEMEAAVDAALHNEARARFIGVELRALTRAKTPVREMIAAAKQAAKMLLGKKLIKDIRPNQFSTAEAKAALAAEKAMRSGDTKAAMAEKRNQLLNNQLARAAHDAMAELSKTKDLFRKVFTPDSRLSKTRNMDLVNAARAILSHYGVGPETAPAQSYIDLVKAYDPALYAELSDMLEAHKVQGKELSKMSLDEIRALRDEVATLWHLSRRSKQMNVNGQLVDRDQIVSELANRLNVVGLNYDTPGQRQKVTKGEKTKMGLLGTRSMLRRVESWVDMMDGGDINGVFRRYIYQPVADRVTEYRGIKTKFMQQYLDLIKPLEGTLSKGSIAAPEIGYSFVENGKAELLHAMLHLGNESNRRKLLLGRGWAIEDAEGNVDSTKFDSFMQRMHDEGRVTKADWDFVQGVWDMLESMKPIAQKAHHDMYGQYFKEVTANTFKTPFGDYKGGYVPAIVDTDMVADAEARADKNAMEQAGNTYMFPTTGRGFTKSRVEYNRPLKLDLGFLPSHIDKVLRFAILEPTIKDIARIAVLPGGFRSTLEKFDPTIANEMLTPWLQRSAQQIIETPTQGKGGSFWAKAARGLRHRTGSNIMVGNVVNAMQQLTGLSIAAVKVPPKFLARSLVSYTKAPGEMSRMISELSPFMAQRLNSQTFEIAATIDEMLLDPSKYEQVEAFARKNGYFLQQGFQNIVDTVAWSGSYDRAIEQGLSNEDAVKTADATVRLTQGSLEAHDVSAFEAGTSYMRLFTMFASYFNMQANLMVTEFTRASRGLGVKQGSGHMFYTYLYGFAIPAFLADMIVRSMGSGFDEDGDGEVDLLDFMRSMFMGQVRGALGLIPVIGQGANYLIGLSTQQKYDDRISVSPVFSFLESAGRAPYSVYKALEGNGSNKTAIRDTLTLLGLATGLPIGWIGRPAGYLADVADNKVEDGPEDYATGLLSGKAPRL